MALGVLCLVAACSEKEGAYSPSRKIAKVYQSSQTVTEYYDPATGVWDTADQSSTPKALAETWVWQDDQLDNIVFSKGESAGGAERSAFFTYNQGRVSKIETANERITFAYSGSKLNKMELYDKRYSDESPYVTIHFHYDGSRLSQLDILTTGRGKAAAGGPLKSRLLDYLQQAVGMPRAAVERAAGSAAQGKLVQTDLMKLSWRGNNVSRVEVESDLGMTRVDYTYDNKTNPLRHFVYTLGGLYGGGDIVFANSNNITKAVSTLTLHEQGQVMEEQFEENYSYSYSDDWPVEKHWTRVYGSVEEEYRITERTVYYYEYAD